MPKIGYLKSPRNTIVTVRLSDAECLELKETQMKHGLSNISQAIRHKMFEEKGNERNRRDA